MISQDRHEIFLVIAKYDKDYVKYLNTGKYHDGLFMTMHEFGPFKPEEEEHMRKLGAYLLAFTSQLLHEANQGNPCRW